MGQKLKVGDPVLTVITKAAPEVPAPAATPAEPGAATAEPGKAAPVDDHSDDGYMAMTRHSFRTARTAEGKSEQEAFPPDAPQETQFGAHASGQGKHARTMSTAPFRRRRLCAN